MNLVLTPFTVCSASRRSNSACRKYRRTQKEPKPSALSPRRASCSGSLNAEQASLGEIGQTPFDAATFARAGSHRLRPSDDACSEVRLDRLTRLGQCGKLNLVDVLEARPRDSDDVATHRSAILRQGDQHRN